MKICKFSSFKIRVSFIGLLIFSLPVSAVTLVTNEEAALPDTPYTELVIFSVTKDIFDEPTPTVIFDIPQPGGEYDAPLDVSMKFVVEDDAEIDVDSIVISYMKLGGINVTKRFREYLKPDGLVMENADIPKGKHTFKFKLVDTKGRVSEHLIKFRVR